VEARNGPDVVDQHRCSLLVHGPDHSSAWCDSKHFHEIERVAVSCDDCELVVTRGYRKCGKTTMDTAGDVSDDQLADVPHAVHTAKQPREPMCGHAQAVAALLGRVVGTREVPPGATFPPGNPVVRARIARVVRIHDEIARLPDIGFVTVHESATSVPLLRH